MQDQKQQNGNKGDITATLTSFNWITLATYEFVLELVKNAPVTVQYPLYYAVKGGSSKMFVIGMLAGLTGGAIIRLQKNFAAICATVLTGK